MCFLKLSGPKNVGMMAGGDRKSAFVPPFREGEITIEPLSDNSTI